MIEFKRKLCLQTASHVALDNWSNLALYSTVWRYLTGDLSSHPILRSSRLVCGARSSPWIPTPEAVSLRLGFHMARAGGRKFRILGTACWDASEYGPANTYPTVSRRLLYVN